MGIIAGATYREGVAYSPDGAMYVTPTGSASITGGTITGGSIGPAVTGVPRVLLVGGVPLIGLSSGSVAANGAISAITALPRIYPSAYCYFPANTLATVSAAGFYYCTFSSTTAGVAFLDALPASGAATIPSSPTAVTDGKGAFTGVITESIGISVPVPALTALSALRIMAGTEATNNANAKSVKIKLSGSGGTTFLDFGPVSTSAPGFVGVIANTGATGKQQSFVVGQFVGTVNANDVLGTVDTSVATTMVFTLTRATATDNLVLLPPLVEVLN